MGTYKSVAYQNGVLTLIDQRAIPLEKIYLDFKTLDEVVFAIKDMVVRGAPAIGATAAYGMVIGAIESKCETVVAHKKNLITVKKILDASRPTAVNLMWATSRMLEKSACFDCENVQDFIEALTNEAHAIYEEDAQFCQAMGEHGNTLIPTGATILTHCNTGALATVAYGTALGVITEAHRSGKNIRVYADETRPRLQGAKLTAWELKELGIPVTLIPDSVAATLIRDGKIDCIIVGADRIASNGDTANKIGTFMLSALAKVYKVPFYVAAPTSTIDYEMASGDEIEIEERDPQEVTHINDVLVAPLGVDVYNPAFDVTPNENITAIITERGVVKPPFKNNLLNIKP